ncbi:hypothetical protein [Limnohabitans sp. Rim11]|uniref:hypothetical protein n=1 Tax=Limnohabitans sp. Rim11 TaxID=1100719 RepID=UPI001892AF0F|nr:hypothetical protein [Limnohabitans sp. Rim11]
MPVWQRPPIEAIKLASKPSNQVWVLPYHESPPPLSWTWGLFPKNVDDYMDPSYNSPARITSVACG